MREEVPTDEPFTRCATPRRSLIRASVENHKQTGAESGTLSSFRENLFRIVLGNTF